MNPYDIVSYIGKRLAFEAPVEERFGIGRNRRQRRLQLMRDIRHEILSLLLLAFLLRDVLNDDNPARLMKSRKLRLCQSQLNRTFADIHKTRNVRCLKNKCRLDAVVSAVFIEKSLKSLRDILRTEIRTRRRVHGNHTSVTAVRQNTDLQFAEDRFGSIFFLFEISDNSSQFPVCFRFRKTRFRDGIEKSNK